MSFSLDAMAVTAPTFDSNPVTIASHAPSVSVPEKSRLIDGDSSDEDMPLTAINGGVKAKRAATSSDEDDKPLAKKPRASGAAANKKKRVVASDSESEAGPSSRPAVPAESQSKPVTNGKTNEASRAYTASESEFSDDEEPLAARTAQPVTNGTSKLKPPPTPKAKSQAEVKRENPGSSSSSESEASSDDEKPLAEKKPVPPKSAGPANGAKVKREPLIDEDDVPLAKTKAKQRKSTGKEVKVKEEKGVKVNKERKVREEEEEDEKYKWWEEQEAQGDGTAKWNTLEHMGVLFPPPYVPLPKGVKMKYDGVTLTLPAESEEVAGFFAAMLETDHALDAVFRANFFKDFQAIVEEYPPKEGIKVKSFDKCDFRPMYEHFEREKEKKKAMTKDEKKAIKEAKEKLEKPYLFATVDGRKEKLGNFRAEPPGLFRGRGEHPRKGTLKKRLRPEDILLNIGKDSPIPTPNIPGSWAGVQHDNTVTWLAHWKENVNNQAKYVFLAAGSSWKGQSDRAKFETARELIKHIDKIRKDYTVDLKSKVMADRQRATALYFIDRLALRAGNEKGEDEADTVGCCSLRFEHVTLEPPNKVVFDFLGKDSMRFHQEVDVEQQVFKNIKIFKTEPKKKGDDLFDRLNPTTLNAYLQTQMKGLSAKVFRTYNASWTFQQELRHTPKNGTVQEKIAAYNTANRDVAILCNHQKTVSKTFEQSFAKMGDKVRALKYQRMKLRYQLFTLQPNMKKKRPDLAEDESDMDEEFMDRHEEEMREKAMEQAKKKWEKDNVKREEEKEEQKPKSALDERLKEIKAEFKELAKERKTKKVEPRKGATDEKLLEQIRKMDERISAAVVQMGDREKTKDVALGTSKINYIDPRLTVAWAKKHGVPLERLFAKTLREKFPWAMAEADGDWVF